MNKGISLLATGFIAGCLVAPTASAEGHTAYQVIGHNIARTVSQVGAEIQRSVHQDIANAVHSFDLTNSPIATRVTIKALAATDANSRDKTDKGE